jgi:hypothetical protein
MPSRVSAGQQFRSSGATKRWPPLSVGGQGYEEMKMLVLGGLAEGLQGRSPRLSIRNDQSNAPKLLQSFEAPSTVRHTQGELLHVPIMVDN